MWFNVWFVIWPNQRKIINGLRAVILQILLIPKKSSSFSRINTFLSVPMLFFMGYGRHAGQQVSPFSVEGLLVIVPRWGYWFRCSSFAIKQSATISTDV